MVLPIIIIAGAIMIFMLIVFVLGVIWVFLHPIETLIFLIVVVALAYLYKSPKARKRIGKALS